MCLARKKKILLDRVADVQIGGIRGRGTLSTYFLKIGPGRFQSLQIWERDEVAEWGIPSQRLYTILSLPSFDPSLTYKEEERAKG